jgi:hypothetical protein
MSTSKNLGEQITLHLLPSESDIVWSRVTGSGHPANADGLKAFLLAGNAKNEPLDDGLKEAISSFVRQNPEVVRSAVNLGLSALTKGMFRGKPKGGSP